MLATEEAGREVSRNLDLARSALGSLSQAEEALDEREQRLNQSWRTLQSEIISLIQGSAEGAASGGKMPTEARVAAEAHEAAAAAAAFTIRIPHAVQGEAAETSFASRIGHLRGGLSRRETALQGWALSLSKAGAVLVAERKTLNEARAAAAELRAAAETSHAQASERLLAVEEQVATMERERKQLEHDLTALDLARKEFEDERVAAAAAKKAGKELMAASEALEMDVRKRIRELEPKEHSLNMREMKVREAEDRADAIVADAKRTLADANAEAENRLRADRDAPRPRQRRRERRVRTPRARPHPRSRGRIRRRAIPGSDVGSRGAPTRAVAGDGRRPGRRRALQRRADLDARAARLREEAEKVELERATLTAIREGRSSPRQRSSRRQPRRRRFAFQSRERTRVPRWVSPPRAPRGRVPSPFRVRSGRPRRERRRPVRRRRPGTLPQRRLGCRRSRSARRRRRSGPRRRRNRRRPRRNDWRAGGGDQGESGGGCSRRESGARAV